MCLCILQGVVKSPTLPLLSFKNHQLTSTVLYWHLTILYISSTGECAELITCTLLLLIHNIVLLQCLLHTFHSISQSLLHFFICYKWTVLHLAIPYSIHFPNLTQSLFNKVLICTFLTFPKTSFLILPQFTYPLNIKLLSCIITSSLSYLLYNLSLFISTLNIPSLHMHTKVLSE